MKLKLLLISCIFASLCSNANATVHTAKILTSGMVLQRNEPVKLWGTADRNDVVTVSFVGKKLPARTDGKRLPKQFSATINDDGSWLVELPALKAGGEGRARFSVRRPSGRGSTRGGEIAVSVRERNLDLGNGFIGGG